jgi:cytidylate kinase
LKLKKNHKLIIACDGGAASGKTTGAKLIAKKYGLKFLSSGLLYRFASYQLLKYKPKNKIKFLRHCFNKLNVKKLNKINLHSPKISDHTSIIAKEKKIRLILKTFQRQFAAKTTKPIIEGRDCGSVVLPKADIKFFFKCNLNIAAKRRFNEFKKINSSINLSAVKKSIKIRNNRDSTRKISPLLKSSDAIIVDTGKLKNINGMVRFMSNIIERKIKDKYGN